MRLGFPARGFVRGSDVYRHRPTEPTILGLVAEGLAGIAVHLQIALHHVRRAEGLQVGVAPVRVRRPVDGLLAALRRDPDRRMRLLIRAGPEVDILDVVVPALESKRTGLGPGTHGQVVRLVKAIVGERWIYPEGVVLCADTANETAG